MCTYYLRFLLIFLLLSTVSDREHSNRSCFFVVVVVVVVVVLYSMYNWICDRMCIFLQLQQFVVVVFSRLVPKLDNSLPHVLYVQVFSML